MEAKKEPVSTSYFLWGEEVPETLGLGLGGWRGAFACKELCMCAVERREGPHIDLPGPF